jgi:hypothetical protein
MFIYIPGYAPKQAQFWKPQSSFSQCVLCACTMAEARLFNAAFSGDCKALRSYCTSKKGLTAQLGNQKLRIAACSLWWVTSRAQIATKAASSSPLCKLELM